MQIPAPIDSDPRLGQIARRLPSYLGGANAIDRGPEYTWHLIKQLLDDGDQRVWMGNLATVLRQCIAFGNPVTVEPGDSPGASPYVMIQISTDAFVGVWYYEDDEDDTDVIIVQALDKNWGGVVTDHILLRTRWHSFPDLAHCIVNWLTDEWDTITSYKTADEDKA